MLKYAIILIIPVVLFNSCVSEYGVAHRNYPSMKMPVPYAEGKDTSSWYAGAAYSNGSSALGLPTTFLIRGAEDVHESVQLNTHYGYQSEQLYFSGGLMGYMGVYHLQSFPIEELHGPLDLWGLGGSTEVGLSFPTGKFHLRPVGIKVTGLYEEGTYSDFRSNYLDTNINSESFRNGNMDNFLLNVSGVFGASYHPGDWSYSFDIIYGVSDEDMAGGVNALVTYRGYSLIMNYTTEFFKGRYAFSGGLLYRF